jgi:hypothetical protein
MATYHNQIPVDPNGLLFVVDFKNPKSFQNSNLTCNDISGNNYTFTSTGTYSYNNSGYISINNTGNNTFVYNGTIPDHNELTVICQINVNSTSNFRGILTSRDRSDTDDYQQGNWTINQTTNGNRFGIETNSSGTDNSLSINATAQDMEVYALTAKNGIINYYFNGDKYNSDTYSVGLTWSDHDEIIIGGRINSSNFIGDISYILVSHKAWSEKYLMNFCKSLKLRF